jgi:outer membrane protein OmpA-like peptidoglycan-associated protein
MIARLPLLTVLAVALGTGAFGCATKKYVRNRVNERVTPLENRTGELEETSRRNTQDISRLTSEVAEVRGRADRAQAQADAAVNRAESASQRAGSAEQAVSDLRANLDKFTVQSTTTVNFPFDNYELTPEAMVALDQLAAGIRDRNNFIIEIQGFADSKGTDAYNYQLTEKRAESVCRYLASRHNVSLFRMHVLGLGELRAVADNTTAEGRARNRRVEIRLLSRAASANQASRGAPTTRN